MDFKKSKAFTIIELLLVIAIIGLLSSAVLVSTKRAKKQAELAKRKTFSQSIKNALGAYIISEYTFDNAVSSACGSPTMGSVLDDSGNGNVGAISCFSAVSSGLQNKSIESAGETYFFSSPYKPSQDIKSGNVSAEFWMYPYTPILAPFGISFKFLERAESYGLYYGRQGGNQGLWFDVCRMVVGNSCSDTCTAFKSTSSFTEIFEMNEWNHIAVTYENITGTGKIYINTNLVAVSACSPGKVYNSISGGWGSDAFVNFFSGLTAKFDNLRIYDGAF